MGNPWRWGALPGEKRDGGALCRLLADAVSDAKLCPGPDTYKRVGFRAGRVFRMREMQSERARAFAAECPCCGKPSVLVECRSGYPACEACRAQMPGEGP